MKQLLLLTIADKEKLLHTAKCNSMQLEKSTTLDKKVFLENRINFIINIVKMLNKYSAVIVSDIYTTNAHENFIVYKRIK